MKLVFYSVVLNQHQAPVADALWELTNHQYTFVELISLGDTKGGTEDFSTRPYLLRAWESDEAHGRAMELARTAECCVFSGVQSLPYMKERLKLGLLSFDMGERWLKQGFRNMLSPNLLKMFLAYHLGGWRKKPLYKLSMSGFAKDDHARLGMYLGKCYKWGYFTQVGDLSGSNGSMANASSNSSNGLNQAEAIEQLEQTKSLNSPSGIEPFEPAHIVRLMWCARFIDWKHPELAIQLARRLKESGYKFHLAMYGDGPLRMQIEKLTNDLDLRDCVHFTGNVPNLIIHQTMRESDIFLFTSDREEGWGAVANEAMSEGCLLIGSDEIGAVPYLVKDGENGLIFKSNNIDSLYSRVVWAIEHPKNTQSMRMDGMRTMQDVWNPRNAAHSLMKLIDDLQYGKDTSVQEGPCSKA